MDELATHFLEAYAAGGEPDGGWKYAKALQQARLDFTPESLARLDALLTQLRARTQPTRADLDTPQGRNFESLVVFYLVELARRISNALLKWDDLASARRILPPGTSLEDSPRTRLVVDAPANGLLFKPLAWLEGRLLDDGEPVTPGDYLAGVLAQLKQDGPAVWSSAMFAVGSVGSWHMMMAADGRGIWPTLITSKAPSTLRHMERGDLQGAVQHCHYVLNQNPEGVAWQVSGYPGYADYNGERVDAVIMLAATYGDDPLRLAVAFPFRPAAEGRRLAILQPTVVEASHSVEAVGRLTGALERGIRGVQWAVAGSWNELYQA
jgi:hypothetical protein